MDLFPVTHFMRLIMTLKHCGEVQTFHRRPQTHQYWVARKYPDISSRLFNRIGRIYLDSPIGKSSSRSVCQKCPVCHGVLRPLHRFRFHLLPFAMFYKSWLRQHQHFQTRPPSRATDIHPLFSVPITNCPEFEYRNPARWNDCERMIQDTAYTKAIEYRKENHNRVNHSRSSHRTTSSLFPPKKKVKETP